ncbi:MAG: membrane protein insertase YidC [Gammaproteobacteria bacterium]
MNPRYIYMAVVLSLSYVLFFQWGQIQQEQDLNVEEARAAVEVEKLGNISILENDLLKIEINNKSGNIVESRLKEYPVYPGSSRGVRVLGFDEGGDIGLKYYIKSGFNGLNKNTPFPYTVVSELEDRVVLESIEFGARKTISLSDTPYEVVVLDENSSGVSYKPYIALYRNDALPIDMPTGLFANASYRGVAFNTNEDPYLNTRLGSLDVAQNYRQSGGWVAFIQKYFMAALLGSDRFEYTYFANPAKSAGLYSMGYFVEPDIENFEVLNSFEHRVFVGPKTRDMLANKEGVSDLELSIDMGWFWFLAQPMVWLLAKINNLVGNWGVSIILLTFIIKIIFWPLSSRGFRSVAKMRLYQDEVQDIRERYKNDPQKMQTETMAFYGKKGINPLGGCLPMLPQFPFFIALFFALRETVELRHAPLGLWLQDLSAPDPLFILPILMALIMFMTQKLAPPMPGQDPTQVAVMKFMPVMFSLFFIFLPSGLVLYSVTNSLVTYLQQVLIYRTVGAKLTDS